MTFPAIVNTAITNGSTAAVNATINYPASVTAGNTLICVFRKSNETGFSFPASWEGGTQTIAQGGSDDRIGWSWKKADGTEGGGTFTISGNNSTKYAATLYQISDAADPTITAPEVSTGATGASISPDPDTVTPTGGAKDYLWIAAATYEGEQTSPPTYPANYTISKLDATSGTGGAVATNCQVHTAIRTNNNAASENPGTFSISASDDWSAFTIAVYPSTGKILDANNSSYVLTGQTVSLQLSRMVDASTGSYTITGTDVILNKGIAVVVDVGSYVINGQDITVNFVRNIDVGIGSYLINGTTVGLQLGRVIDANIGTYLISGSDITLELNRLIDAGIGNYLISGTIADLLQTRLLDTGIGSYIISGTDVDLILAAGKILNVDPGSYLISGQDSILLLNHLIDASASSYIITGTDVDLIFTPAGGGPAIIIPKFSYGIGPMDKVRIHPHPLFSRTKQ